MKTPFLTLASAAMLLVSVAACNSNPGAVEQAQNINENRIEANTPDSTAAGSKLEDAREYDANFMTKAASGGMLEVQLGQTVAKRAATTQAKQVANTMVTDHTKANNELKDLAAKLNVTLPAALGDDAQDTYKDVTEKKGLDMDKAYLDAMESDHRDDIDAYEEASKKAASPELRAFAAKTLPTLRHHLAMIQHDKGVVDKMNYAH